MLKQHFKPMCSAQHSESAQTQNSIGDILYISEGFPDGSLVKSLPAMKETWVQSLGGEDPLAEGMAAHSSVLAWRTPWTEEPGGCSPRGPTQLARLK